jgi:site-specific DNA-methyltransferase (adenine-specific)
MSEDINYNPDVLACLANLSNDEVFTPPDLVNEMLDCLPKELFENKDATFLDPGCKSGVFLREIAKRLDKGLETKITNKQERINHIFKNQLYGIAITEITSLLSRRSVYCSKKADSKYSIIDNFKNEHGNILYKRVEHSWKGQVCEFCGASKQILNRSEDYESYAYQFIHTKNSEEIFNMKFDVIIGNPPYQLNVGVEKKNYAVMIFQKFVETAIRLQPTYVSMILPSRWFTGGRGLDNFREKMLNDKHIREIVDYMDSRDCFNGVDISGGAMYFVWDKNYNGNCKYTNIEKNEKTVAIRNLGKRKIFNRNILADSIIDKVESKANVYLSSRVSSQTPFGLHSNFWDKDTPGSDDICVLTSKGKTYTNKKNIKSNSNLINLFKVVITKATSEHAGQVSNDGTRKVLARIQKLQPGEVCSQTYLIVDSFKDELSANYCIKFLKTKFVRFLLLQALPSQDISKDKFCFVPFLDYKKFSNDEELYKHFLLSSQEKESIDKKIKAIEE